MHHEQENGNLSRHRSSDRGTEKDNGEHGTEMLDGDRIFETKDLAIEQSVRFFGDMNSILPPSSTMQVTKDLSHPVSETDQNMEHLALRSDDPAPYEGRGWRLVDASFCEVTTTVCASEMTPCGTSALPVATESPDQTVTCSEGLADITCNDYDQISTQPMEKEEGEISDDDEPDDGSRRRYKHSSRRPASISNCEISSTNRPSPSTTYKSRQKDFVSLPLHKDSRQSKGKKGKSSRRSREQLTQSREQSKRERSARNKEQSIRSKEHRHRMEKMQSRTSSSMSLHASGKIRLTNLRYASRSPTGGRSSKRSPNAHRKSSRYRRKRLQSDGRLSSDDVTDDLKAGFLISKQSPTPNDVTPPKMDMDEEEDYQSGQSSPMSPLQPTDQQPTKRKVI